MVALQHNPKLLHQPKWYAVFYRHEAELYTMAVFILGGILYNSLIPKDWE